MTLFATDKDWISVELVYWPGHAIPHPDVTFSVSNTFLTHLVMQLIDEREFSLDCLVLDKYRLRDAVAAKFKLTGWRPANKPLTCSCNPIAKTLLEEHPEICFSFPRDAYPYNTQYGGKCYSKNTTTPKIDCQYLVHLHQPFIGRSQHFSRSSLWLSPISIRLLLMNEKPIVEER